MRFTRLSVVLVALALSVVPAVHAAPVVDTSAACQALGNVLGLVNGVVPQLVPRAVSATPLTSSTTPSPATASPTSSGSTGSAIAGIHLSTVSPSVPQPSSNSRIQSRRQLPSSLPVPNVVGSKIQSLQSVPSAVVSKLGFVSAGSPPSKPSNA